MEKQRICNHLSISYQYSPSSPFYLVYIYKWRSGEYLSSVASNSKESLFRQIKEYAQLNEQEQAHLRRFILWILSFSPLSQILKSVSISHATIVMCLPAGQLSRDDFRPASVNGMIAQKIFWVILITVTFFFFGLSNRGGMYAVSKWWSWPAISGQLLYLKLTMSAAADIPSGSDIPARCAGGFHCNAWTLLQGFAVLFSHPVLAWTRYSLLSSFSRTVRPCHYSAGCSPLLCRAPDSALSRTSAFHTRYTLNGFVE